MSLVQLSGKERVEMGLWKNHYSAVTIVLVDITMPTSAVVSWQPYEYEQPPSRVDRVILGTIRRNDERTQRE